MAGAGLGAFEKAKIDGDKKMADADLGPIRYLATSMRIGNQDAL